MLMMVSASLILSNSATEKKCIGIEIFMNTMISVSEAKRLVQAHIPARKSIATSLTEAHGYTLAEDILAHEPSPRFTNSAMDGVAVRFVEDATAYKLIGESAAGSPFLQEVRNAEAVRISTGAVLPDGADTVIPVEDIEILGENIVIKKPVRKGQWVRVQGAEYLQSACVLRSGTVLRPAHIALAAQLGYVELPVFAAPKMALIATGREIVSAAKSPEHSLNAGQIYDANTPMLQAAIIASGGECTFVKSVGDTLEATIDAISEAMLQADIICTTGGVSVGEHDFIKQAAQTLGFETIFWRVRQKPGKPLFFAKHSTEQGTTLLFGLPGNPVSTLMCFIHYVQPVIASLLGRDWHWQTVQARASTQLANTHGRAEFLRVQLVFTPDSTVPTAVPLDKQDSFMLTSLTEADGFIFLDIDAEIYAGAPIEVLLF
jgi:molybdopterin molybdotransferase